MEGGKQRSPASSSERYTAECTGLSPGARSHANEPGITRQRPFRAMGLPFRGHKGDATLAGRAVSLALLFYACRAHKSRKSGPTLVLCRDEASRPGFSDRKDSCR